MLGAAPMTRACAIVILATTVSCALVHERDAPPGPPVIETGITPNDVGSFPLDVAASDASTEPFTDAGPITSCVAFWDSLSACPAVPTSAVGQPCTHDGDTCGVHCCEPGPPIGCVDGRWTALDHMDDCAGIRCHGPHPCGPGQCAYGRVCVVPSGELGSPSPQRCVLPPAPIDSCAAAPPGSLGESGSTCTVCSCGDSVPDDVVITLDCQCC